MVGLYDLKGLFPTYDSMFPFAHTNKRKNGIEQYFSQESAFLFKLSEEIVATFSDKTLLSTG